MTTDSTKLLSKPAANSKLTPGMITALSLSVSRGNYAVVACELAGSSAVSLYAWLKQAAEDERNGLSEEESLYLSLSKSLKRAEAEAEDRLVAVVREAAEVKREWIPAITFLERRHPDRWGRKDRTRIDINETREITITHVEYNLTAGTASTPGQVIEGQTRELKESDTT